MIDLLMADAHDSEFEQPDERQRVQTSQSYIVRSTCEVSRNLFGRAKPVGKRVKFD